MRLPDFSQTSAKRKIGDIELDEDDEIIALEPDELTEEDILDTD
ncbi:MAG: hypothetical protein ABIE22_01265 [archaeon]